MGRLRNYTYALVKRPVTLLTLLVTDFNIKTQREKKSAVFFVIVFAFVGQIYHSLLARQLKLL